MKYTLCLDSSNIDLTVGLIQGSNVLASTSYEAWQCQSEHMIPEIDTLFKKYDVKNEDIENIIVSIGPGSYTGIRIALTIAKTMAVALPSVSIYLVSSLQVLKNGDKPSICLINARSNRSYFAVYQGNECLQKDQIKTNEEVLAFIKEHPDYCLCGDTRYLSLDGYKSDITKEMLNILPSLKKEEYPLSIKPIYMKG